MNQDLNNQPAPDERRKGQTSGYDTPSLEDKAPNEHFTESGDESDEEKSD